MSGFLDATTTSYFVTATIGDAIPITMPATVDSGDVLFMFHSSARVMTTPSGWTGILTGAGRSWYRIADGSEGGTTVNWHAGSTGDYVVHAVIMRYHFDVAFTTPIGNSDTWAFGDTSGGTQTAHKDFTENPPTGYELRLYVVANTYANENYMDPVLGLVGAPREAGPVTWTSATELYSDEAAGTLGTVPDVPSGTTARCDLLTVAERWVVPGASPGSDVDVVLSPDGGQVGNGYRVRLAFTEPPGCLTFRSSTSAQQTSYSGRYATGYSVTVDKPAGVLEGDILVAVFGVDETGTPPSPLEGVIVPTIAGWTVVTNSIASGDIRVLWKVAGPSEPSTYTFETRSRFNNTITYTYINAIIGAWDTSTVPSLKTLANSSKFKVQGVEGTTSPPGSNLASVTISGSETTTDGLAVYIWSIREFIENGDGTSATAGNPFWPATIPYATTIPSAPIDHHADVYYGGLPQGDAGEFYIDEGEERHGITTLAGNRMLTLGSSVLAPGPLPDGTATFTWQHAGNESGFAELVHAYRLVFECVEEEIVAYWGIHAVPL